MELGNRERRKPEARASALTYIRRRQESGVEGARKMTRVRGCERSTRSRSRLQLICFLLATRYSLLATPAATPADVAPGTQQLDTVNVNAKRYEPYQPAFPAYLGFLSGPLLEAPKIPGMGFPTTLGAVVVTATRTPQPPDRVAASLRVFDDATLRTAPTLTLDGALRSVPGFSLFRRSDSFTANPTAQGVSLRGLGPSGASRSLILFDGVPLNDPFGGWVTWTKLPREGLARAEIVPGGGATAWGNAALGGVVQLFATPARTGMAVLDQPPQPLRWVSTGALRLAATVGDYGTHSEEVALTMPTRSAVVQLFGRNFGTDGFTLVAPERHGPIDVPAWSRHRWLMVRWRQSVSANLELLATARAFEEERGNGTPYQHNGSREKFASLALAGQLSDAMAWNAVGYAQTQGFASTFSSVNASRTAETPASDQFAVPSTAFGAAWTGAWRHDANARTSFGADTRFVRGETRENFTFAGGNFTRLRMAGGRQLVSGLFGLHERPLTETLRATLGARLDNWREADGHRSETDRTTGAVLRNDRYADRDGTNFSPSAGLVWTPQKAWRVRANAQQAFRRPTLNELYRPFRVGANVTEANADLRTERVTSAELGTEWTLFHAPAPRPSNLRPGAAYTPPVPLPALTLGLTAFANDLRDAVGNVTIARGPGTFPIVGTIAAGGVGRQRLNLDRTRVRGLELSAKWTPLKTLTFTGDFLANDATVRRAPIAPGLVGNRVAQVPRQSGSVGATWLAPGRLSVAPRLRWIGRQFEDDENQLILGAVVIGDLSLSRPLTKNLELFITGENLGNARNETGRSADGIVNIGTPRLVVGGLRGTW
jgi:outer membrane receptor protein involved in Fe transport